MTQLGSAAVPESLTWNLRNVRTGEVKSFEQTELTIEGEARLIGLAPMIGRAVRQSGYDYQRIATLFDDGPFQWELALDLVGAMAVSIPELAVETASVFLGIYPTTIEGLPNEDYDPHRAHLRASLKLAHVIDMVEQAAKLNDFQRLVVPFSKALSMVLGAAPADESQAPPEVGPQRRFEPSTEPDDTSSPQTTAARTSETGTPSGSSPTSPPSDLDIPDISGGSTPDDRSADTPKPLPGRRTVRASTPGS